MGQTWFLRQGKNCQGYCMIKGQRKANGNFELSEAPSYLIRRCQQFYGDLYAREPGAKELTKQQFTLLCALEHNDGASQTALVEITGIDRSTLAEMVRRMLEKGLLSRERTEEDQRANAVAISASGRKALRAARNAVDRAERVLLEALTPPDRQKFIRSLGQIAAAAEALAINGYARARKSPRRKRTTN
jgi:DNA-binding MarR family transcriptional regulator